jgi:hypothetical protein
VTGTFQGRWKSVGLGLGGFTNGRTSAGFLFVEATTDGGLHKPVGWESEPAAGD